MTSRPREAVMAGTDDLVTASTELAKHIGGYTTAEQYECGEAEEVYATPAIAQLLQDCRLQHGFNIAATPINAMAARLRLVSVTGTDDAQTAALAALRERERMDLLEPYIERRALVYGECYALVWPNEEGRATIRYRSPRLVRAIYDDGDPLTAKHVINRWAIGPKGERRIRADLYYVDRIERWVTMPGSRGEQPEDWFPYAEDGRDPEESNPYGALPFFHFRTGLPYGRPYHADAFGPQDAVNKLLKLLVIGSDAAVLPERAELLDPAAVLDQAQSGPGWSDDTKATKAAPPARRQGPGSVHTLAGVREIVEFTPPDLSKLVNPVELVVRVAAQATTTALHYFDPSGDVPSGESLRTADAPAVSAAQAMQRLFGAAYRDMYEYALMIDEIADPVVATEWAPLTKIEDRDGWDTISAKQTAGVPAEVTLREAGYGADQVTSWQDPAAGDLPLTRRVELISEVAAAAQRFSAAAATLPGFDAAGAGALLAATLAEIAPESA